MVPSESKGGGKLSGTLQTYSHLLSSMQQEVVETLDGVFGENNEKSKKEGP